MGVEWQVWPYAPRSAPPISEVGIGLVTCIGFGGIERAQERMGRDSRRTGGRVCARRLTAARGGWGGAGERQRVDLPPGERFHGLSEHTGAGVAFNGCGRGLGTLRITLSVAPAR
ncbi:hypothetical protein BDZ91DRAFT_302845 [Kalaharituber pfeilii]|nr:hypothetical protein BDZ91DRAFT_302845 [Kalaharituber pfeilii]